MANKKISELTELTTTATGDLVPIVDVSDTTDSASGTTKKITMTNLLGSTPGILPNASTTSQGVVEEATQAEVDAQTAAGATGARLFINPSTTPFKASTTAMGAVEEATSAEMIAGTATGGTGARLFLNPSLVAETGTDKIVKTKSTGFLDSSIIPVGKIEVDATEITVANTVTETTLFDVSVPGGTLSTNNAIRFTVYLSDFQCDSSESISFRMKYGGSTVATCTMATTGATTSNIDLNGAMITGLIVADGSTSAQKGFLFFNGGDGVLEDDNLASVDGERGTGGGNSTGAVDSTSAQTLSITAQWAATGASNTITAEAWIVEKIA